MAATRVTVHAAPRLHLGLLDLGGATSRKYGGAGFSIDRVGVIVTAERSSKLQLVGTDKLDEKAQTDIARLLKRLQTRLDDPVSVRIEINEVPAQHVGLGTKTALLLSMICATCKCLGYEINPAVAQSISGRGGTSGVGIHAFFNGGFVMDFGHRNDGGLYAPSGSHAPDGIPLLSRIVSIPDNWLFALILPNGIRLCGESEDQFFRDNTPIPDDEVYKSVSLMYHNILPSIITCDLEVLSASLSDFQRTGFKRREVLAQSSQTRRLIAELEASKIGAVGMSSLGPLLFIIFDRANYDAIDRLTKIAETSSAKFLGAFEGNNSGYEVTHYG